MTTALSVTYSWAASRCDLGHINHLASEEKPPIYADAVAADAPAEGNDVAPECFAAGVTTGEYGAADDAYVLRTRGGQYVASPIIIIGGHDVARPIVHVPAQRGG